MTNFKLPPLPGEFHWRNQPVEWGFDESTGLSILAGPKTDWFVDPGGTLARDNTPAALSAFIEDHFLLSARVSVRFASTFDAGVLQVRAAPDLWAKLCFEFSPDRKPMIVSVVTRGVSDDCNSVVIEGLEVHLRVARTPQALAFHYSHDGRKWRFVRHFSLGVAGPFEAGFSAQSPTGEGCQAVFSDLTYRPASLRDLRNGE